jgi:hypothetical protein
MEKWLEGKTEVLSVRVALCHYFCSLMFAPLSAENKICSHAVILYSVAVHVSLCLLGHLTRL